MQRLLANSVRFNFTQKILKRTFLTENYFCYEKWDKYLLTDLMKNVGTVNSFAIELDQKLKDEDLVTPLDMDILATKTVYISNFQELDFIENVFLKFRKTQSALFANNSMHYGLVRSYIDLNQSYRLLQILKLKYKYGLFVDSYTANMLMDYFIKENDFEKAALTAHEVMLQEINENEITLAASLLSCSKCSLEQKDTLEQIDEESEGKTQKRLVSYKRSEYNDEHFDLKSVKKLNGKTIWFCANYIKSAESILVDTLKIYGILLLGKFDEAVDMFENVYLKEKSQLYSFLVKEIDKTSEILSQNEGDSKRFEKSLEKWADLQKLCENDNGIQLIDQDILLDLQKFLEKTVRDETHKDIEEQNELFEEWEVMQKVELKNQIKNFNIELKKSSILKRLNDLERQEEMLTYFDKKQEIVNAYHNQGFAHEDPAFIPIEPEESQFNQKFERHFKPYQKYANRPAHTLQLSNNRKDAIQSLRKIYFDNRQAQTQNTNEKLNAKRN